MRHLEIFSSVHHSCCYSSFLFLHYPKFSPTMVTFNSLIILVVAIIVITEPSRYSSTPTVILNCVCLYHNCHYFRLPSSVLDLYWTFFGLLKSPDLGLHYRSDDDYMSYLAAFIFIFYSIAAIVVLLNLLIAVMTSRYSAIEVGHIT